MAECVVVLADSIEWMREQNGSDFDLIIADPSYNVGKDYGTTLDQKEKNNYLDFTIQWASEVNRLLKPNGTVYVFMGFKFISHLYKIFEEKCDLNFNTWICWHYTQGQGRRKGYSARHDDIDPRMRRVPLNLHDPIIREQYVNNHINWFLGHHENDITVFKKEVERIYGYFPTIIQPQGELKKHLSRRKQISTVTTQLDMIELEDSRRG